MTRRVLVGVWLALLSSGTATLADAPPVLEELRFSKPRGFHDASFAVAIASKTPGTVIRYTTDGSIPSDITGRIYQEPLTISHTTTLRARAFKDGFEPSRTSTATFLFLNDVLDQVYSSPPPGWPASGTKQQVLRYGLNPTLKAQYSTQQLVDAWHAIPSVSIVTEQANLTDELQGIYVNASQKGSSWERAASVEWLPPGNAPGFQIDAGLRIRGGYSRRPNHTKHALRLFFRGRYGAGRLRFPVHGTGVTEFQTLDLRTEQHYGFANTAEGTENTAVREVFARDLMGAIGQPTTRSQPVHLYLNGQYWGLYQTEERPQEDYGPSYFGGRADDYDVMQTANGPDYEYEVASGTIDAWQRLWTLARAVASDPTNDNYFKILGRNESGEPDPGRPVLLDVDNLATYMLVHYYTGDGDGPVSAAFQYLKPNNWRGIRNRTTRDGFRFFVHDAEHTLLAPLWVEDRVNTVAPNRPNRADFKFSNPEWMHEDLAANLEYRVRFSDLAHRLLSADGALTAAKARPLFDARAAEISQAILGDIVRWGQNETGHTLRQWNARINAIRSGFFSQRPAVLLKQLRTRGFYPSLDAPTFARRGGTVGSSFVLTLSAESQAGAIYYTIDGSDPRAVGGGIASQASAYDAQGITIASSLTVRARVRDSQGKWSALEEQKFSVQTQ